MKRREKRKRANEEKKTKGIGSRKRAGKGKVEQGAFYIVVADYYYCSPITTALDICSSGYTEGHHCGISDSREEKSLQLLLVHSSTARSPDETAMLKQYFHLLSADLAVVPRLLPDMYTSDCLTLTTRNGPPK